jgi:hypothetical protein
MTHGAHQVRSISLQVNDMARIRAVPGATGLRAAHSEPVAIAITRPAARAAIWIAANPARAFTLSELLQGCFVAGTASPR